MANIYEKLQKCRVELQKSEMKKTGYNKFSNYYYFELGDFLPRIQELMMENKLAAVFHYGSEMSTLTIINVEKIEEQIIFESPVVLAQLKGCHEIQNIGSTQTYSRRYLYVMAFEIAEHDAIDSTEVDDKTLTDNSKIDKIKLGNIKDLMEKANISEQKLCDRYEIKKVSDITNAMYPKVLKSLEDTVGPAVDTQIDDLKLKSLIDRMKTAGVDESVILEGYQLDSLAEMTVSVYMKAMNRLEKTIQKKNTSKPVEQTEMPL